MATRRANRGRPPGRRRGRPLLWIGIAAVSIVAFLYYQPIRAYVDVKQTLADRRAEIRELRAERRALERRLRESGTDAALVRQARRLGLVRPGERLFIVKGIDAWRRSQVATIGRDG